MRREFNLVLAFLPKSINLTYRSSHAGDFLAANTIRIQCGLMSSNPLTQSVLISQPKDEPEWLASAKKSLANFTFPWGSLKVDNNACAGCSKRVQ